MATSKHISESVSSDQNLAKLPLGSLKRMLATIIAVGGYDFENNSAEVILPGNGERAAIPIDDVITPCLNIRSGTAVLVDDALTGKMLLATPLWSLIMPHDTNIPIVVATSRVTLAAPGSEMVAIEASCAIPPRQPLRL